jgi:holo-[acyl-carrier protein] synthase
MGCKIGTDIVEVARIKRLYRQYGEKFLNKILSPSEKEIFYKRSPNNSRQIQFLANRFAAKEAIYKAIAAVIEECEKETIKSGPRIYPTLNWSSLSISNSELGIPYLEFDNNLREYFNQSPVKKKAEKLNIEISLSDETSTAIAFVVINY